MNTFDALNLRISANKFDTSKTLTSGQIKQLVDYAMQAPSAYNIQHTRFIAVHDSAAKKALKAIAYGQQKVEDASVTFIVLADVRGHEKMRKIGEQSEHAGIWDAAGTERMVKSVNDRYSNHPERAREEAIRSASMAAMNLMTAATAMGLVSGPMIGFDPEQLLTGFNIDKRYVPAMLITVGYEAPGNWPRKPRLATDEVLVADGRPGGGHLFSATDA
jgi:nitroreductase